MSSLTPHHLYPVAVIEDRYGGGYSGGEWLAIATADDRIGQLGQSRVEWALTDPRGPSGDDLGASDFWCKSPSWISVGSSPEQAIEALVQLDASERSNRLLESPKT